VQAGHDPAGLCRDGGVVIPTYCNDTVVRMPPDVEPAMDRQRMRDTGRRLADAYLRDPPLLASDMSAEPAASDGFTVEEVVGIGEQFSTDLPDAR
jgi:hypothetical protein